MALDLASTSEIVAGLILKGRLAPKSVRYEILFPPYNNIIKFVQEGNNSQPEDLIEKFGFQPIQTSFLAIENMNGLGDADWVRMLEEAHSRHEAGAKLEKYSKKLLQGEDVPWDELRQLGSRAQQRLSNKLVPLSQVEGSEVKFIKSGWYAIDEHLTGLPEAGLITVGGNPGIGKTTFMAQLAVYFAKEHPDKRVLVFSIEMLLEEIAARFRELSTISKDIEDRIILCEVPVSPQEAISIASTIDNLGLVCIDFADMMITESSEANYSSLYLTLALGAKSLHVPLVLLSQLIKYQTGLPKPIHLRWTKMAEAFSWMIWMLYDPSRDWQSDLGDDSNLLPILENKAYILAWKVRGGFRNHLEACPGAICLGFKGSKGWSYGARKAEEKIISTSRWFSLRKTEAVSVRRVRR